MIWPVSSRFDCRSKRYGLRKIYMVLDKSHSCYEWSAYPARPPASSKMTLLPSLSRSSREVGNLAGRKSQQQTQPWAPQPSKTNWIKY